MQLRPRIAQPYLERKTNLPTAESKGTPISSFQVVDRGNGASYGDSPERHRFMIWEQIEAQIARGGISKADTAELWDSLFLREIEIGQFLEHARAASENLPSCRYIHPALSFCAYTGARRSEMFRCQIDDITDKVLIREKKRSRHRRITYREVPLHRELKLTIDEWLARHPGGQYLFCKNNGNPLEDRTSRYAFGNVTNGSRWEMLRGYHVLRHSFASNLARHGVEQYKIDQFMGHQTDEMRERYRHLFPEDAEVAIGKLDFSIQGAAV